MRKMAQATEMPACLNQRILVTGGAGFLGSHLYERLVKEKSDVICLDNFFTGQRGNVAHLIAHPYFKLVNHDVTIPYNAEIDTIYNFACPASPFQYQRNPIQTIKTCVYGSINMLELAERTNARILQASTSEVYGNPFIHPQKESYWGNVNPTGIRSCYDEGKRCAETLFFDYHRQKNIGIKVARIFNTYGPRMHPDDGRVVSNFIVQALKNEDISIYGDGNQTRSFCYVDDIIDAVIKIMKTEDDFTGPVNIGSPVEFTIGELAEKIIELTASRSKITFHKMPEDDPKQRCPDIALAKDRLNWEPGVSIEDGLKETIAYFRRIVCNEQQWVSSA